MILNVIHDFVGPVLSYRMLLTSIKNTKFNVFSRVKVEAELKQIQLGLRDSFTCSGGGEHNFLYLKTLSPMVLKMTFLYTLI